MNVVLHRRSLDLASGAGQLIAAHAVALERQGAKVTLAAERGRGKFLLRAGRWPRAWGAAQIELLQAQRGWRVVDHSLALPRADLVFVHNLQSEARRYFERSDSGELAAREAEFFASLRRDASIVANSRLVAAALERHFELERDRLIVLRPGYDGRRFAPERIRALRAAARRSLGIADDAVPLFGLVTSGDFAKRGLDVFLGVAESIARGEPRARFLVVGSKALPDAARAHPLVAARALRHQPKSRDPARWFAALDVFVYPASFEEFGMVVLEALACGLPVLTSRRVGAAECLPAAYDRWVLDAPDAARFAALALALAADRPLRERLGAAGAAAAARYALGRHAEAAAALILGSKTPAQINADAG